MINIISRPTLIKYISEYPNAANQLNEWYYEFKNYRFENFNQLKTVYKSASLIGNDRVIFNIKGNDYRLILKINFAAKMAYVIWFGTHAEYDKIDAKSVVFKR